MSLSITRPEARTAIVRWILAAGTLAAAISVWPELRNLDLSEWALLISLAVLVALIENLGVQVTYGMVTFMPVVTLMAYFTLGLEPGLAVVLAGLVLSALFRLVMLWRSGTVGNVPWWRQIGRQVWPMARHGLSMLAADWAFRQLGATPPLMRFLLPRSYPRHPRSAHYLSDRSRSASRHRSVAARDEGDPHSDGKSPPLAGDPAAAAGVGALQRHRAVGSGRRRDADL